ncbi:MAG: triose-phosphate isomerase [Acidocella sp. 20-57-95]|nr:MAG: triose-phosphate isomerase [Acidocella sp. 20-57-95]OYV61778.1 MAG: triose-phosphate isomerase [Acidocella sp. 21-58-7]HQT65478.1 triose-phosphate isomerase [Acidocella sp.]HQU03449.1 triose-phosphate isomerase [Acidocella sp.]
MRQVIAGNWKMSGSLTGVAAYAAALQAANTPAQLIVCPPFPLLPAFAAALAGSEIGLGAQDCHANISGAHTGDVAAALLKEIGASYVILGHSERRADHAESNAVVAGKVKTALAARLIPIVCVGESEAERDVGEAENVVCSQLTHSLPDDFTGLVAYEPIWAIGTGKTPTEADITAMHAAIRAALVARFGANGAKTLILYGGSVKPSNASAILALPEVGGALVGGASLVAADFTAIAASARVV